MGTTTQKPKKCGSLNPTTHRSYIADFILKQEEQLKDSIIITVKHNLSGMQKFCPFRKIRQET